MYNYLEAVKEDIKEYIEEHFSTEELKEALSYSGAKEKFVEKLNDDLWVCDSVTGNASGSYTFNTWQAEENLCHNMDLLQEALQEFGCDISYLEKGAEACDVTIRCYLLNPAICEVLEELENEMEE